MRATGCLCSIAGKPAPTGEWQLLRSQHICRTWLASDAGDRVSVFNRWQASSHRGSGNFSAHSKSVGAWLASDEGDRVPVFNRWQASSHRGAATFQHTANLWEPGLPAMRATGYLCSIAGKPAPTGEWQCTPLFSTQLPQRERQLFRSQQICRSLACQR